MGIKTTVIVNGIQYESIQEAALHFGVLMQTAARRLRSGWTPEQAFGVAKKRERVAHNATDIHTSRGTFKSIRALAEFVGIDEGTIGSRLRYGWTHEQAAGFSEPPKPTRERRYNVVTCEGLQFNSWADLAANFGKREQLVSKRLRSGWTPEQAVDLEEPPPRFRRFDGSPRNHLWREPTVLDGKLLPGAPAGSYRLYVVRNKVNNREYIGITTNDLKARWRGHVRLAKLGRKSKFYNAIRKYGAKNFLIELVRSDARDFSELQAQEMAEIAVRNTISKGYNTAAGGSVGTSKPIEIAGTLFPSHQAAAGHYGVDAKIFNQRMSEIGWTPEEAVGLVNRRFSRRSIEINGKRFASLKSAAEALGLKPGTVQARITRSGMSFEEALGLKVSSRLRRGR
jgi:hypothetical protein